MPRLDGDFLFCWTAMALPHTKNRKIVHVQSLTPDGYLSFLRLARTTKGSVRPGKSIGWSSSPAAAMG